MQSFEDHNAGGATSSGESDWIARSNEHARVLVELHARFRPEEAGQYGAAGLDELIADYTPGYMGRIDAGLELVIAELERRLTAETDRRVQQDIRIMANSARGVRDETRLAERLMLPYVNVAQTVFAGVRALLNEQIAPERRPAALIRMRRYCGLEPGYRPLASLVTEYLRERLAIGELLGPTREEVLKDLGDADTFVRSMGSLFAQFGISDFDGLLSVFGKQAEDYSAVVRRDVLPRCREDYRLPPELYRSRLRRAGIDMPAADLVRMAHAEFDRVRQEMADLAPRVAAGLGFSCGDYRAVIQRLKADQWGAGEIVERYRTRLEQIDGVLRRRRIVPLPESRARIRLATEAESAEVPAPHLLPPRLLNNRGEVAEFVLPSGFRSLEGQERFDDFTFAAASWTLSAHELRPGHELQFHFMLERGVSLARAIFAYNSANVEGWGVYAESLLFPFMPPEAQLISLQHRLLRAARAFLDPQLQDGTISIPDVHRILQDEVVLSRAMARQEVERYTTWLPGQAGAYFYGYMRLLDLRREVESSMGSEFDQYQYHSFLLRQGLLPLDLLRQAVMDGFVPVHCGRAAQ